MARDVSDPMPISTRDELVAAIESGSKPRADWRVGTEHEKFGFHTEDFSPVPYEGPRGIRHLLDTMEGLLGWQPIMDAGRPIGLVDPIGLAAISLEPGGQFELSGAPLETIHQTGARTERPPRAAPRGRRPARHRLPRPRLRAFVEPGRNPSDAEIALRDHVALHAEGRQSRPRHDVPDLHRAGQSRFLRRSRHAPKDARLDGAAADRHRNLRQLALHRGQAERAAELALARSGATPTPPAPASCPSCSRRASASSATSTGRSTCRCTSSSAARPIMTWPARRSAT